MHRVVAIVLVIAVLAPGCVRNVSVTRQSSSQVHIQPFERVWVAGFVSPHDRGVDVNGMSVRLLRSELRNRGFTVIDGEPLELKSEATFNDASHWRLYAEDHRASIVVTGSVDLLNAPPKVTPRGGRGGMYKVEPGLFLESRIVLIDGATGLVTASYRLPLQARYGLGRNATPLLMYLGMMDQLLPEVVRVISGSTR